MLGLPAPVCLAGYNAVVFGSCATPMVARASCDYPGPIDRPNCCPQKLRKEVS